MTKTFNVVAAILAICLSSGRAYADCNWAVSSYKSAVSDIEMRLKRYLSVSQIAKALTTVLQNFDACARRRATLKARYQTIN